MAADGELFVKVCGITRLADAELAAELGASAIGMIFWPGSPRYIDPDSARAIVRSVGPNVTTVGVFVDELVERVNEIADRVGLGAVQLHGAESPGYCRKIRSKVIKAIGLSNGVDPEWAAFDDEVVILLDAHDPERHGGTGRTIDWSAARRITAARRSILSGGLNSANVRRAIGATSPYGVDVSSGVEASPGIKDATKMKDFFEALHD